MTIPGQNVEVYKGDTKTLVIDIKDTNSTIVDITGVAVNYVVYKGTSGTVVITKTTISGVSITDPSNGIFEIYLLPVDTENLLGYYLHECEITDTSNNVSTVFTGKFTIIDSKA